MNKSKSSFIFHINQTEGNNPHKSSKNSLFSSTIPNIRTNFLNGFFYESFVEKYNEKINLWQNSYLCVKRNYLYLYDKKPKLLDKPKEFLFLNNKITFTLHKKLFKMKTIKCYVVNFKINNEALSKSLIEDNTHNLFLSFKTQKNYDNFLKVINNVLKSKLYTNSVSPNQFGLQKKEKNEKKSIKNISTDKKMKKSLTSFHLKNKSVNEISISKSLIFSDRSNRNKNKDKSQNKIVKEKDLNINKDNIVSSNNNKNINSKNKTNKEIHNVFTFSKVENLSNNRNDKRMNSNSANNSKNLSHSNSLKNTNNKMNNLFHNENNIFLEKNTTNNLKKNINYFTINFSQNNSKKKSNNIFDTEESTLTNNEMPRLVYSIRRKKDKEKEHILNFKRQRTKSCYGFKLKNILLSKEEEKENRIKEIKIRFKDFNSFCHNTNYKKSFREISDYSCDEKNLSLNYQDKSDTTDLSITHCNQNLLNDIEEEKNVTESKSKKDNNSNSNINMSFGSLKSFKSESKDGENNNNTNNNNDCFEGINLYSYVDASDTTKNKSSLEDSNPLSSLNIPNIRNHISNVIKQNEEIISQQDNDNNSNIIFTPRLKEEIQNNNIITGPNSSNKKEEENNAENNTKDNLGKIELSNKSGSNTFNTSISQRKTNLRFSNDLDELIQSLETKNYNRSKEQIQTDFSNNDNDNNEINMNEIYSNNSKSNNSNEKDKEEINNKSLENTLNLSNKSMQTNKQEDKINFNKNGKLSIPFNKFFNENLLFNFMNFNFNFLSNNKSNIKELMYMIDNNLIFIYDSNILYLLLKKIKNSIHSEIPYLETEKEGKISKPKILGKIYDSNNKCAKYFLLCEMVAIISKKELSKLIITSIEIFNKKKELNPNEPTINFDEYVYNIFNKYLSRNESNKEYINLYDNILIKEIKNQFGIKDTEGSLINIIKKNVHPHTLFNSMQYHTKIYINNNIDNNNFFNYKLLKPFDKDCIIYISPFILEKWKYKASLNKNCENNYKNHNNNIEISLDNNTNINNINPINESFDSNGNYSRDMSNTSLSCIVFDKNNKFRLSLISKSNDTNNNSLCTSLIKNEKKIYEDYKLYEKAEDMQKLNLFQNIILNINQDDVNSALKNCQYFLQKYQNSTLFLHPLIYLCLAYIYNKKDGFDSAQKYIKKSLKYLTWLFPYQNCFLFYEIEYKYLLIILNNEENIIKNNLENIENIFAQCFNLWKKYYENQYNTELKMVEIVFRIYFKITDEEKNDGNYLNDLFYSNIKPLMNEIENNKELFLKEKKEKNLDNYWKLFLEFFKNCPGCGIMVFNDLIRSISIVDN